MKVHLHSARVLLRRGAKVHHRSGRKLLRSRSIIRARDGEKAVDSIQWPAASFELLAFSLWCGVVD
jgi:hypothetical protein